MADDRLARVSGQDALATQDEWATAPAPAPAPELDREKATAQAQHARELLALLTEGADHLGSAVLGLCDLARADEDVPTLALAADQLTELRRRLAATEAYLLREAGQVVRDADTEREGLFPDGRVWKLRKGAIRKAWDHEAWKKDARAQVLSGVPEQVVDPATGEGVDVSALLLAVQEVHGSTSPRVAQLKALGLSPDDYCESYAGPWGLEVSAPSKDPGT